MVIFVITRHIFRAIDLPHIVVTCLNKLIEEKIPDGYKNEIKENSYEDNLILASNDKEKLK